MPTVVLFPAPLGPSRPTISPAATVKLTSATAVERAVGLSQPVGGENGRHRGAII